MMLCSRPCAALLMAAACLLMQAGFSRAQISGSCYGFSLSPKRVITCDTLHFVQRLSCVDGFVISVQSALYGRRNRETCSKGRPPQQLWNTHCSQKGTTDILKRHCDGKTECEINTNVVRTSDPCYGTYKYLETTYSCIKTIQRTACEGSVANLDCGLGQVIRVLSANYGRHDRTTCSYHRPTSQITNTHCSRPTGLVAKRCNGKKSCSVEASNSVFGDPCFGTYKYLEVSYVCEKL